MDCEKFESAMMDELYGELDEVTSAAVKRHVAGCSRCAALIEGLRATRRVAAVPLVDLPPGLEDKILAATREASNVVPLRRRVARAISLAGSWAMRPQTAMAAVFLVMIGTSVLLLRGKSSRAPASSDVIVTEQGSPAPEPAASATTAMPMAPAASYAGSTPMGSVAMARSEPAREEAPAKGPAAHATPPPMPVAAAPKDDNDGVAMNATGFAGPAPTTVAQGAMGGAGADTSRSALAEKKGQSAFDAAVQTFQAGRYAEAQKAFDALAPSDPSADLWAARAVREGQGCRNALARFDRVARRASGGPVGWDALLEGALCYRAIGDFNNARTRLTALLNVDSHKDRAQAELDRLNQMQQGSGGGGAAGVAAKAARAAPAPAAPAPPPPARPPASAVDSSY